MPFITYPNVPQVAGVPQVLRKVSNAILPKLASAAGIAQLVKSFTSKPKWGIYGHVKTGGAGLTPIVTPDSFRTFSFTQEWTVTTAPVQNGGFVDFNRVGSPFENKVRMTKGGSVQDRIAFIKQVESLDNTTLYDIVTPEKTYTSVNLLRVELERTGEKGAYWFAAYDVYFREIRNVTAQYTKTQIANPQSPSAANVQNNGVQQGTTSTRAVPTTVAK